MSAPERIKKINTLRFEGLSFAHAGYDATLKNVDFEFPAAKAIWLKSTEGAGKSTLLQLLAGLLVPQSGSYFINDENVTEMTFEEFLKYRLSIGYTFDYGGLISNRTVFDNLMLPLIYHELVSITEAKKRVEYYMELFELAKFRNERPASVPGRIRKLTCLVRALVIHPQVLLMDDPSVGLSSDTATTFSRAVNDLREQGILKHLYISSYDNKFMDGFDFDTVHINEGQLYFHKAPPTLKKVVGL